MNCAIHNDTPAVAYCRTCGKALCENCKRDVMGAIYCEPCIAARLQGGAPTAQPVVPVSVQGAPSPGLAALLGMIPGVGAMYNSQFVKAFIHVIIFAGLIMAQEYGGPAEPLFGLLTAFFWFYMVFDAYQTAKARLLGRTLPDFLGLERLFGIHEIHPVSPTPASPIMAPTQETTPAPNPPLQNIPTGAMVLIGLGVFFLLVNLGLFRFHHTLPLLLIAFGLWLAYKRSLGRA